MRSHFFFIKKKISPLSFPLSLPRIRGYRGIRGASRISASPLERACLSPSYPLPALCVGRGSEAPPDTLLRGIMHLKKTFKFFKGGRSPLKLGLWPRLAPTLNPTDPTSILTPLTRQIFTLISMGAVLFFFQKKISLGGK